MPDFIYLASQSPRRAELLTQLGVRFRLLVADPDEDVETLERVHRGETARHYVQRVTALKAGAALLRLKRRGGVPAPVLAADTTVALRGQILGKPESSAQARQMLHLLSDTTHRVLTAVAVTNGRRLVLALSESRVRMKPLSRREIECYVASGEPLGKAGSYAIQGRAAAFVSHFSGSYSGIVGLPLFETAEVLRTFRVARDEAFTRRSGPGVGVQP